MPLGPEVAPPLMSPGGQLLASPLGLTFPSPGLGRTPGAHVVQEGRLSLEMLGMLPADALAGYAATGVPPGILAPLNAEASVRAGIAGVLKSSSIVQPNPSAGNQQPKLTPPALATATSEQLSAKDAYAAKLKQALPEKLSTEASGVIKSAKSNLGLPEVDTTRIEATVSAALAADANALAALLPSLPTLKPQQLEKQRTNEAQQQTQQPQRTSRRVAAKRARDPEADVDPATLPPPKRVARMEALYNQLRALHDYNVTLSSSIRQLKGDLEKLNEENENLWAATAHIGAAMHAAIEERDAQAGEISFLPGSLGEEEPEELDHHHPLQHPHHPLSPLLSSRGGSSCYNLRGSSSCLRKQGRSKLFLCSSRRRCNNAVRWTNKHIASSKQIISAWTKQGS